MQGGQTGRLVSVSAQETDMRYKLWEMTPNRIVGDFY